MMSTAQILEQPDAAPGRILVVDDEPTLLRTFARILRAAGYQIDTANNGQAATVMLSNHQYDAVLSDISMPIMDGIELLNQVHRSNPELPFILMTAGPQLDTATRAVELGALRYMSKPLDMDLLREAMKNAVTRSRTERARRAALAQTGAVLPCDGELEARFDRALAAQWMAFQPIVRWSEKRVFGYEALVRTREPSVPHPGVLFDLAERVGGLDRLGRAIRASVAGQLCAEDAFNVFVNLHPMDLLDEQLFAADAPLTRFAPRVVLEITERESLEHIEELGPRLADLKRRGFRIAIDDLGAGYAGLSSFSALEPDVVKLDMSLVRGVHKSRTAQKVIASIRGLCDALGTLVVAEGIETVEERDALAGLGCDLMQGYLFGRPGPYLPQVKFE